MSISHFEPTDLECSHQPSFLIRHSHSSIHLDIIIDYSTNHFFSGIKMDFSDTEDAIFDLAMTQFEELSNVDTNRFGNPVTTKDIDALAEKRIPENTKRNMQWSVNAFKAWRVARNKMFIDRLPLNEVDNQLITWKNLEDFTTDDYNFVLPRFLMETRKKTGHRYPASSLWQMLVAIQGFIRMKGKHVSFLKDPIFKKIADTLDWEMKESTAEMANKTKQADVIDPQLENKLWDEGVLGLNNPQQVLDTLMYLIGYHFALRASDHKALNIGEQLSVETDENGDKYLLYQETTGKTFDGGLKSLKRKPRVARAYAHPTDVAKCPVHLYQLYTTMCPKEKRPPAFYLHPLPEAQRKYDQWYARRPIGVHPIEGFLKRITSSVGAHGNFTPHSLRATAATRLFHGGVEEQLIMEQTGHSSMAVRRYKRTSSVQKKAVSGVLQQLKPTSSTAPILPTDTDSADEFLIPEPPKKKKPPTCTTVSSTMSKPPTVVKTTNSNIKKTPEKEDISSTSNVKENGHISPTLVTTEAHPTPSTSTSKEVSSVIDQASVIQQLVRQELAQIRNVIPAPNIGHINPPSNGQEQENPPQIPIPREDVQDANIEMKVDSINKVVTIKIKF